MEAFFRSLLDYMRPGNLTAISQTSNSASLSTAAFDPLCRLIPTAFKYRSYPALACAMRAISVRTAVSDCGGMLVCFATHDFGEHEDSATS